ncbi:MAG: serine hydrolase [Sphingomonas sp.]
MGSAFKLVILAELIRATNAGERRWTDAVTLDGAPLPGGVYTQAPAGTRVALRELATKMISISDNSATDILIKTLGRARIEAMLPVVGIADPRAAAPADVDARHVQAEGGPITGAPRPALIWPRTRLGAARCSTGRSPPSRLSAIDPALFVDGQAGDDRHARMVREPRRPRPRDGLDPAATPKSGPGAEARAILAINPAVPARDPRRCGATSATRVDRSPACSA